MNGSATLLISRQSLYPCRSTAWVESTIEALTWLSSYDYRLVSSIDVNSWNAATAIASHLNLPLRLVVSCDSSSDYFRKKTWAEEQFDLVGKDVLWDSLVSPNLTRAEMNRLRDETVVGLSQMLLPISVRPNGIMDHLINSARKEKKAVNDRFAVPYEKRTRRIAYEIDRSRLTESIREFEGDYLIHWTRTCNSVWPEERLIDYFRDVINSESYPRRAINTLLRIIESSRLIASTKNMPQNTPTVAFSALKPAEAMPLMRWRSRYHQMSFEPYGIGIKRSAAEAAGIQPVRYYDRNEKTPESIEPWLTQSNGIVTDWTAEKEFRIKGNLRLSQFDENDLLLFVRTTDEAEFVHEKTGLRTIAFLP